jgi:hypothetical protein
VHLSATKILGKEASQAYLGAIVLDCDLLVIVEVFSFMQVFQGLFDDHQELLVLLRVFIWHSLALVHLI